MRALEPWHLLVLIAVVAVLFGGKRLPDAARGLGRSMRIFKSEIRQLNDDAPTAQQQPSAKQQPAPLEGRVVDGDANRSGAPTERHREA